MSTSLVPSRRCNDDQIRRWRDDVVRKYAPYFTFSDPAKRLLGKSATPYEIVETDLRAIDEADGLLVNMWRESIGSAIGVVHAHRKGKPVVVADPNHLKSRMLDFYADAVQEVQLKAARALLDLLRAEADWLRHKIHPTRPGTVRASEVDGRNSCGVS